MKKGRQDRIAETLTVQTGMKVQKASVYNTKAILPTEA